jgi:hypothetical protein
MTDSVLAKAFLTSGNGSQDVRTPHDVFERLDAQYRFDLDPCDSIEKPDWLGIPSYNLNRGLNGLKLPWYGNVFVNPPWNDIQTWITKAFIELEDKRANFVIFFIPSRTETNWYHRLLNSEFFLNLSFLNKRVHFDGQKGPYVTGISVFCLVNRNHV